MCGIVGCVGKSNACEWLISGLKTLEYRGYDSAGIALQTEGGLDTVHAVGNLAALELAVQQQSGLLNRGDSCGIGHTRWATHGRVSIQNAHPHSSNNGAIQIVLNGIVENFKQLRQRLEGEGCHFSSETDAEVVAHLISLYYEGDLLAAARLAYADLEGHYAFVAVSSEDPDLLVGARKECPLIVGRGDQAQFIASAIPAFLKETREVQYIEDGEFVVLRPEGAEFFALDGSKIDREIVTVDWDTETAEKGGYETFMLKEIHEQADAVAETIADRTALKDRVDLGDLGSITDDFLNGVERITVVACGTSYHAGMVGRYAIEQWARVPVEMDVASEYRYRNPVVRPTDLVVGITQSGETADTLAAMRLARERGAKVLAVTNVMGSQATRDADGVLYTRAGLEIGVAATKTFVSQVAAMYLLGLKLAQLNGKLETQQLSDLIADLKRIPAWIEGLVDSIDAQVQQIAEQFYQAEFFLYIGRHIGLPIALEGALKLKEISYIATDAYAAGEMKHGPIALLDEKTPVVCVATDSPVLEKVISNMQEVAARGAHVVAVATEGSLGVRTSADQVIEIPNCHWMLQPLLAVVPLQLLAYHIAKLRGLNVDQPRNLAKTVTVE